MFLATTVFPNTLLFAHSLSPNLFLFQLFLSLSLSMILSLRAHRIKMFFFFFFEFSGEVVNSKALLVCNPDVKNVPWLGFSMLKATGNWKNNLLIYFDTNQN